MKRFKVKHIKMNSGGFGIVFTDTLVKLTVPFLKPIKIHHGTLIQFDERDQFPFKFVTGRVIFPDDDNLSSNGGLDFEIQLSDFQILSLKLLQFCVAIQNRLARILFCLGQQNHEFLENLEVGSKVMYFNDGYPIPAEVEFIGFLNHRRPGIYIGVKVAVIFFLLNQTIKEQSFKLNL